MKLFTFMVAEMTEAKKEFWERFNAYLASKNQKPFYERYIRQ